MISREYRAKCELVKILSDPLGGHLIDLSWCLERINASPNGSSWPLPTFPLRAVVFFTYVFLNNLIFDYSIPILFAKFFIAVTAVERRKTEHNKNTLEDCEWKCSHTTLSFWLVHFPGFFSPYFLFSLPFSALLIYRRWSGAERRNHQHPYKRLDAEQGWTSSIVKKLSVIFMFHCINTFGVDIEVSTSSNT